MIDLRRSAVIVALATLAAACATQPPAPDKAMAKAPDANNPLLVPWSGPYGGIPPFGNFKVEDIAPALEAAMATAVGRAGMPPIEIQPLGAPGQTGSVPLALVQITS